MKDSIATLKTRLLFEDGFLKAYVSTSLVEDQLYYDKDTIIHQNKGIIERGFILAVSSMFSKNKSGVFCFLDRRNTYLQVKIPINSFVYVNNTGLIVAKYVFYDEKSYQNCIQEHLNKIVQDN